MPFHTIAFSGSPANATTAGTLGAFKALGAITDGVMTASGMAGFLMRPDLLKVIGAFGLNATLNSSGGNNWAALLSSSSLSRIGQPYLRPLQASNSLTPLPASDPNFVALLNNPFMLDPTDSLVAQAATGATGSSETIRVFLWLCDEVQEIDPAGSFWLPYSVNSSGSAAGDNWISTTIALTPTNLPLGRYRVIGMEHWGPSCLVARLRFPLQDPRPGVVALGAVPTSGTGYPAGSRSHRFFYEGQVGVFGEFDFPSLPNVEVYCTGGDPLNTHQGYLQLVKVS